MKKIFITLIALFSLLLTSCEADSTGNVTTKVTNYATFEYEPVIVLPIGGTYVENVVAKEDGKVLPLTVSGTVNTAAVGVYDRVFSAINSDGFAASVSQKIVVHNPAIIGTDISGKIQDKGRTERKATITLVAGTTSIFYCTDFAYGGAFPMYFQMNGNVISEVNQVYPLGVQSVDLTYDPTSKIFTTLVKPDNFAYTFEYY